MSKISQPTTIRADSVEWVVNDNAELGVKIGDRFFFLYKGTSLEYRTGLHDEGTPMRWRPVYKREFGECCHPHDTLERQTGEAKLPADFTKAYGNPDDWKELPRHLTPEQDEAEFLKAIEALS